MQNYEQALRAGLPLMQPAERRRMRRVLDDTNQHRRKRRLERMEAHTRAHFGLNAVGAIDWSKIINPENIKALMELLLAILPMILKLFA